MATRALTGIAPEWFTPTDQRPDKDGNEVEDPTRYKLKPLNGEQFIDVMQHGTVDLDGNFRPNMTGVRLVMRYALKDWENLLDEKNERFAFNLDRWRNMTPDHIGECVEWVLTHSGVAEIERKNSESQ